MPKVAEVKVLKNFSLRILLLYRGRLNVMYFTILGCLNMKNIGIIIKFEIDILIFQDIVSLKI